jgi:hypothetical protein
MTLNNLELIRPLLKFDNPDLFYFVQILQRKKDGGGITEANNNARLVKAYCVHSEKYLDYIMPECIKLAEVFNARVSINLNRRSYKTCALKMMQKVADKIINESQDTMIKAYSSVVGAVSHDTKKTWIIDIDEEDMHPWVVTTIANFIETLQPIGESKIVGYLPSKTGLHILTRPFNLADFKKEYPDFDVQKNSPTNLYIP